MRPHSEKNKLTRSVFDQATVGRAETPSETFRLLQLVYTTVRQSGERKCDHQLETKVAVGRRISFKIKMHVERCERCR